MNDNQNEVYALCLRCLILLIETNKNLNMNLKVTGLEIFDVSLTLRMLCVWVQVGNTILIIFVSFFGSRVHRPRYIGAGALLACLASLLMGVTHFMSEPYHYTKSIIGENTNTRTHRTSWLFWMFFILWSKLPTVLGLHTSWLTGAQPSLTLC